MSLIALGLNHTTAPLDVRGRFAFPGDQLVPTLRAFSGGLQRAAEVAIVSTCNRTELYVGSASSAGSDTRDLAAHALGWLAQTGGMAANELLPHFYVHEDAGAARHAVRLASGLSSMVVGETQILGQMKLAVREADTLLLTVPNMLGVDYNVRLLETIVRDVAPAIGWTRSA